MGLLPEIIDKNIYERKYPLFSILSYHVQALNQCQDFTSEIVLDSFLNSNINIENNNKYSTTRMIDIIAQNLFSGDSSSKSKILIDLLTKRFEICRKIHEYYQDPLLLDTLGDYSDLAPYAYLSLVLLLDFSKTNSFKSLNTSLKINDLIVSQMAHKISHESKPLCYAAIQWEISFVEHLRCERLKS